MLIASCPAYINPKWYKKDHWEGFLSTFPMARMKIKSDLQQLPDPLSLQDGMASNAPLASPQLISSLGLAITRHGGTAHGTASFERGLRLRKRAEDASAWLGFKLWIIIFWLHESMIHVCFCFHWPIHVCCFCWQPSQQHWPLRKMFCHHVALFSTDLLCRCGQRLSP